MNNNLTEPYVSAGQLNIPAGLFFTRQPQRASASGPDQTAVFSVTAIGAVSYQWQYNDGSGWTDIDGAESDTFETVIGPGMHGWKFRCIVEDADGASAASAAAYVTVTNTTEITLSGPVASIDYGPVNIKALLVDINAVQAGTGDPSPENVRPISGWDTVNVTVCGQNIFDADNLEIVTVASNNRNGHKFTKAGSYAVKAYGTGTSNYLYARVKNADGTWGDIKYIVAGGTTAPAIITITDGQELYIYDGVSDANSSDKFNNWKFQVAVGTTQPSSYEPYNGTTYPLTLPDTVYGGTLDVTRGALTVTHGYIASYDGEELPGAWISDRDVYAEGTTPTAGAEVVYELDEPTTDTITAAEVKTDLGYNNIFADSGDVEVIYKGWPNAEPESVGLGSLNPNIIQDVFTPDVIEDVPQTLDVTPEFDTLL